MRITFQSHHEITTLNQHRTVVKSPSPLKDKFLSPWILPKGHQLGHRPIWPSCSLGVFPKTGTISLGNIAGWSGKLIYLHIIIYIVYNINIYIYIYIYLSIFVLYFIYIFLSSFIYLCLICLSVDIKSWLWSYHRPKKRWLGGFLQIMWLIFGTYQQWIGLPSAKHTKNHGKIHHFIAGKIHHFYIFNSYVSLPKGKGTFRGKAHLEWEQIPLVSCQDFPYWWSSRAPRAWSLTGWVAPRKIHQYGLIIWFI